MNEAEARAAVRNADQKVADVWARQPRPTPQDAEQAEWNARNVWNREVEQAEAERQQVRAQVWEAWRAAGRPDWNDVV